MNLATDRVRRGAFITLQAALATLALVQGAYALRHGFEEPAGHQATLLTAGLQVLGGLLFLWPRTMQIGGWVLVAVFIHAALYQIWNGAFPAEPLVFAAAAFHVTMHASRKPAPVLAAPEPEPD